jgi:hypothetical protein
MVHFFEKTDFFLSFILQRVYVPALMSRGKGRISSDCPEAASDHTIVGPSTFFRGHVVRIEDDGDIFQPVSLKK